MTIITLYIGKYKNDLFLIMFMQFKYYHNNAKDLMMQYFILSQKDNKIYYAIVLIHIAFIIFSLIYHNKMISLCYLSVQFISLDFSLEVNLAKIFIVSLSNLESSDTVQESSTAKVNLNWVVDNVVNHFLLETTAAGHS